MTTHACGCRNAPDPASGVVRSVLKCPEHSALRRNPAALDAAYYSELGIVDRDGNPRRMPHVRELAGVLGPFPTRAEGQMPRAALEIGCGCSPYAGAIRDAGWSYLGLDASPWAAEWTRTRWGVVAEPGTFEDWSAGWDEGSVGLILAAHALEHMADAPAAIRKCAELLAPGGELWAVVPDGRDDPVNPDHLWFFDPKTLRATVEAAGLEIIGFDARRIVAHEDFQYLRARKPAGN